MSSETALDRKFVRHVAGMLAFMEWQERWKEVSRDLRWRGPILELHDIASQRWGLAAPRHPGASRHPVLLVQNEERRWLERIGWDGAVYDQDQGKLALIAKAWDTPSDHWPSFAVVLQVNPAEKWAWLASTGTLEARPIWWGADDHAHVSHGPACASWQLEGVASTRWLEVVQRRLASASPIAIADGGSAQLKSQLQPQGASHVGSW